MGSGGNARSPRAVGIGPPTAHQVSVPAKEGVGLDEESLETPPVKEAQAGEQRSIRRLEHRAAHLATQDGDFVEQHDDLDRKFIALASPEAEQLEDPDERQVQKGQRHSPASSLAVFLRKSS